MKLPIVLFVAVLCALNATAQTNAQPKIDSLRAELLKATEDSSKVLALKEISTAYAEVNRDEALDYARQALSLAESISWKAGIADCNLLIGQVYYLANDYPKSLEYRLRALKMYEENGNKKGIASSLIAIGNIHWYHEDSVKVVECYTKALAINREIDNKKGIALSLMNLARFYEKQNDSKRASDYYFRLLDHHRSSGNKGGEAVVYGNIYTVYLSQSDYSKALEYAEKSLRMFRELGQKNNIASMLESIGGIYLKKRELKRALQYQTQALALNKQLHDESSVADNYQKIGTIYSTNAALGNSLELMHYSTNSSLRMAVDYYDSARSIYQRLGTLQSQISVFEHLSEVHGLLGNHLEALANYKTHVALRDSVFNKEKSASITQMQFRYDQEKIDMVNNAELKKQKLIRDSFIVGFGVVLSFAGIVFHQRNKTKKQKILVEREKARSEHLLLNILPAEVAEELKNTGTATAKNFSDVTVLLTDFKNFTTVSEQLSPQELVDELHVCFKTFDEIISAFNIEKIKTIGDAYLAVCGLPLANDVHATQVLKAALEIRDFMLNRRNELGDRTFEIRLGVHSGSVVAGIVGVKKFAYDIWGDTVNTAARMEQSSEAGKINISESTFQLVKDQFSCEYRGEISAKNKGNLKMYFVERSEILPVGTL